MRRVFRVLIGFAAACLAAGGAMVLFVLTPADIASLPAEIRGDRMGAAAELAAMVAVQAAIFSAPLALIALWIAEASGQRQPTWYLITGLAIAGLAFYGHLAAEQAGEPTIVNNYAMASFLAAGFAAGLAYWLIAGRLAGPRRHDAHRHAPSSLARESEWRTARVNPSA